MGRGLGFEEPGDGGVGGGGDNGGEGDVVGYFVDGVGVCAEEVHEDGDEDGETVGCPEIGLVVGPEVNVLSCVDGGDDCGSGGVVCLV